MSKTVIYALYGKKEGVRTVASVFDKTKVPHVHKHNRDVAQGVSPHIIKCTRWKGSLYQFGQCRFEIEKV